MWVSNEDGSSRAAALTCGSLPQNPPRVGTPLERDFEGQHGARRGDYRVLYEIRETDRQSSWSGSTTEPTPTDPADNSPPGGGSAPITCLRRVRRLGEARLGSTVPSRLEGRRDV